MHYPLREPQRVVPVPPAVRDAHIRKLLPRRTGSAAALESRDALAAAGSRACEERSDEKGTEERSDGKGPEASDGMKASYEMETSHEKGRSTGIDRALQAHVPIPTREPQSLHPRMPFWTHPREPRRGKCRPRRRCLRRAGGGGKSEARETYTRGQRARTVPSATEGAHRSCPKRTHRPPPSPGEPRETRLRRRGEGRDGMGKGGGMGK
jgi:hypothetical protein